MSEMYFSGDVESNGPVPSRNAMLSIGLVALHPKTLEEVGTFYRTLQTPAASRENDDTMKWWSGFPEQYKEARLDAEDPYVVMCDLENWVHATVRLHCEASTPDAPPTPTFVAYPAAFDFAYYAYYAHRYTDGAVFGFSALDMGSLAMGHNHRPYNEQSKKNWPAEWVADEDRVAIHHALKDAQQQGRIFRKMMRTICPERFGG